MPEIAPDLSDRSRCVSVHWTLPVQCVLPRTHANNWHEAWHPQTGNRMRYRRAMGAFVTEEHHNEAWHDLPIPAPGAVCGEPHPVEDVGALRAYAEELQAALNQSENDLTGARLSLWEEEQDTRRLRLALESAKRGRRDQRARVGELEGEARTADRDLGQVIDERDRMHDVADKLAYAVAPIEVIGEHSSGNDPWDNAYELVTPHAEVEELRARVAELEGRLNVIGTARIYRLESGKKFIYVEDIADAVIGRTGTEAGDPR